MANALDELKTLYPVFIFKNRTNQPQEIPLDNDSVQVPARGTTKLRSKHFINLPRLDTFTFIQPTLDDLRAVGLLATKEVKVEKKQIPPSNNTPIKSNDGAEKD